MLHFAIAHFIGIVIITNLVFWSTYLVAKTIYQRGYDRGLMVGMRHEAVKAYARQFDVTYEEADACVYED